MGYTTYLLGAGASANVIPLYKSTENNFSKNFCNFIQKEVVLADISKKLSPISFFSSKYFETICENILNHSTVDTYARKLYLRSNSYTNKELEILKILISFYLEYLQFFSQTKVLIDPRYDVLYSNILKPSQLDPILDNNIRILSWNYDNQLELGLLNYNEEKKSLESIQEQYGIYPQITRNWPPKEDGKIIKLNGHAGHYMISKNNETEVTSIPNRLNNLENFIENLAISLNSFSKPNSVINYMINFAWEVENPYSRFSINSAREILSNTEKLIIIGYSFPGYNHDVDTQILSTLNPDSKILYQSLENNSYLARKRFNNAANHIKLNNIEHTNYIEQFVLPWQFSSYFE